MSKAVKKVGKAFKKVAKAAWKIIKPVAIAVAAYFTAGVALSFIPATAGFAASLPGFAGGGIAGLGFGAGSTAGTGYFSMAAAKIGLGGGLASGALKGSAMMGAMTGVEAAGVGAVSEMYGAGVAMQAMASNTLPAGWSVSGGSATVSGAGSGISGVEVAGAAAGAGGAGLGGGGTVISGAGGGVAGGGGGVTLAGKAGMSLTDKLLLAKVGTDVVGAAFGPTELDMLEAQAEYAQEARKGSYYGMDPEGNIAPGGPDWQLFKPEAYQPQQMDVSQPSTAAQEMIRTGDQSSTQPAPMNLQQSQPMGPISPSAGPTPAGAGAQPSGAGPGINQGASEDQTRIQTGRQNAQKLFQDPFLSESMQIPYEQPSGAPGLFGAGQMKQQVETPPGIFAPAPGVRYV